jgi:hypothetical protein
MSFDITGPVLSRLRQASSLLKSGGLATTRTGVSNLASVRGLADEIRSVADPGRGKVAVAKIVTACLQEKGLTDRVGKPIDDVNIAKIVLDELAPIRNVFSDQYCAIRYLAALLEETTAGVVLKLHTLRAPGKEMVPGDLSVLADLLEPFVPHLFLDDAVTALSFLAPLPISAADKGKLIGKIYARSTAGFLVDFTSRFTYRNRYSPEARAALTENSRAEYVLLNTPRRWG